MTTDYASYLLADEEDFFNEEEEDGLDRDDSPWRPKGSSRRKTKPRHSQGRKKRKVIEQPPREVKQIEERHEESLPETAIDSCATIPPVLSSNTPSLAESNKIPSGNDATLTTEDNSRETLGESDQLSAPMIERAEEQTQNQYTLEADLQYDRESGSHHLHDHLDPTPGLMDELLAHTQDLEQPPVEQSLEEQQRQQRECFQQQQDQFLSNQLRSLGLPDIPSPQYAPPPAFSIHPLHPLKVKSPTFLPSFSMPPQQNPDIFSSAHRPTLADSSQQSGELLNESLPIYPNASAAPSRLPAHKPVRLKNPKHPLAREGTPVFFKYGEEHYPEETVPDAYTFRESDGTVCRYITNFLVYNKRGERLLPIEVLDQPRHGALVLYGSLLPASFASSALDGSTRSEKRRLSSRRRGDEEFAGKPPYPIRVELSEWCIDYGQEPQNVPFIWLISRWDVYYRLEKPAGRYIPTFASAKLKFEVSTRIIKTLQWRPDYPYRDVVDLLTAATRQERKRRRVEEERRRNSMRKHRSEEMIADEASDDELFSNSRREDEHSSARKKNSRPNWKVHNSLSTPEGTGVPITLPDGQVAPLTPWGAAFAVEGLRESNLLGLTDFLESQMRNFLEGVGGSCANLLETRFMQTLREKASIRRETLVLVEAKKRSIESMTAVNGFGAANPFDVTPPAVALQVLQPVPVRQVNAPVGQGCAITSRLVTIGFGLDANRSHHQQAMMILKSRHQEEQELNQLLHLLKEFSDPDERCAADNDNDDCDTEEDLGNSEDEGSFRSDLQNCRPPNTHRPTLSIDS